MNTAARRLHARKARNRLILTRVGQVLLTVAIMSTLVLADRLGAHYRAATGHLFPEINHATR